MTAPLLNKEDLKLTSLFVKPAKGVETSISISSLVIEVNELKTKIKKNEKDLNNINFLLTLIPRNEYYVPDSLFDKCDNQQRAFCHLSKEALQQDKAALQEQISILHKEVVANKQLIVKLQNKPTKTLNGKYNI